MKFLQIWWMVFVVLMEPKWVGRPVKKVGQAETQKLHYFSFFNEFFLFSKSRFTTVCTHYLSENGHKIRHTKDCCSQIIMRQKSGFKSVMCSSSTAFSKLVWRWQQDFKKVLKSTKRFKISQWEAIKMLNKGSDWLKLWPSRASLCCSEGLQRGFKGPWGSRKVI